MKYGNRATDGPGIATGAALFRQAQAGCRDSLAQLMAMHEGLVHAVVRQQILGHLPFAEALQAGRIGLWHAILGFDPEQGMAFSTYAWTSIMHQVWREVKLAERDHVRGAQTDSLWGVSDSGLEKDLPEKVWESEELLFALWKLVARLPERLRIVIVAR